jgi:tetratricopeptide (TPR) repeat protein
MRHDAKDADRDGREPVVVELLTPYLRHNPDDAYAWHMFGDALRVVGRFRESESALLRAFELAPDSKRVAVSSRLAVLYNDMGRYADAERHYSDVAAHPEWKGLGWLWILRGANLARLGNYELAEECHCKATTLEDVHGDEAWLNLGLVLRAQGKYEDASSALRKSLELDSTCSAAEEALNSMEGIETAVSVANSIDSQH